MEKFSPLSVVKIEDQCSYKCSQNILAASSEFGTYRVCEQRRFRRARDLAFCLKVPLDSLLI